jgi:hypothetical protein
MHPWITSDKPGNCTICGMALVPIYEGEAAMESKEGVVSLNPRSVNVLAVTTVPCSASGRAADLFRHGHYHPGVSSGLRA